MNDESAPLIAYIAYISAYVNGKWKFFILICFINLYIWNGGMTLLPSSQAG